MNVLGIDCSASIMSISLKCGDRLFESSIQDGFKNSENLMPLIDSLFKTGGIKPSDLNLVSVASGPGSFTGLRIAMSTAKGISFGAGCDLVSVPTLDTYALGYDFFEGAVIPVIDARKKRVYASLYHKGKKICADLDIDPASLLKKAASYERILITGPDSQLFSSMADGEKIVLDQNFTTTASTGVIKLGVEKFRDGRPDPHGSGPVYIRKSEAEISMFGE